MMANLHTVFLFTYLFLFYFPIIGWQFSSEVEVEVYFRIAIDNYSQMTNFIYMTYDSNKCVILKQELSCEQLI